jgi:hypothetical protein
MTFFKFYFGWLLFFAYIHYFGTARRETAAGRQIQQRRRLSLDRIKSVHFLVQ